MCEIRPAACVERGPRDARHEARIIHEARNHSHVQQVIIRVPAIAQTQVHFFVVPEERQILKGKSRSTTSMDIFRDSVYLIAHADTNLCPVTTDTPKRLCVLLSYV